MNIYNHCLRYYYYYHFPEWRNYLVFLLSLYYYLCNVFVLNSFNKVRAMSLYDCQGR